MRPQLLMGAVGIFIFGTLLSCICSGRWLVNGDINIINALTSFSNVGIQTSGGWEVPKSSSNFLSAIITCLTWDYPYLDSSWALFIKIPLWLISIGVVWALIEVFLTVVQGLLSAVGKIFS